MTEVLLFHQALGQTPGFLRFADALREAGHLFADPGSRDYDTDSARLPTERALAFLERAAA